MVVTDPVNGFRVALPAGWAVLDDTTRTDKLVVTGSRGKIPEGQVATQAASAFGQGAKLIALATGAKVFASNVNVILQPADGLDPDDIMKVVPSATKTLEAIQAKVTRVTKVTVDGVPGVALDYTFRPAGLDQDVQGRQIYAVHKGKAYITSISQLAGTSRTLADTITRGFRFL